MNRRGFLGAIAAAAVLDPERLLWRPGARLISVPRPPRVLLNIGDIFTIEGRYVINPVTREIAVYTDPSGEQYRFLRRFIATEIVTDRDGDGQWALKAVPIEAGGFRPFGPNNRAMERIVRQPRGGLRKMA